MNIDQAKTIYREARECVALVSLEWCTFYDVEAGRNDICVRDDLTGHAEPIASLLPECGFEDRRLMTKAPTYLRAAILLAEAAFTRIRVLEAELAGRKPPAPKDYAAECAMKCNDRLFRIYLSECHGVDATDSERINTRVRSILAIRSRAELNTDPAAKARWRDLKAAFDAWRAV